MRGFRAFALIVMLALMVGCAALPHVTHRTAPNPPSPTHPVVPAVASHTLTGRAMDSRNIAISGVTIGLKLTTATAGCTSCGFYSTVTTDDGTYALQVPDGVYLAACGAGTLTCRFAAAPDQATVKITMSGTDLTADIVISAPSTTPTTAPSQQDNSGTTISGHVYSESGKPLSGVTVEFREEACPNCMPQPFTTTNASGAYSISVNDGVYNAECPTDNCGPKGGNGGPFPVTVPPSVTLDFIVCSSSNDYPACLRQ
jgi:hypothetical protein